MKNVILILLTAAACCSMTLRAQVADISVSGNGIVIPNGDVTPSLSDHTDFGNAEMCIGTVARTFTITNNGSADLHIASVFFAGTLGISYHISAAPAMVVPPGGITSVEVTFDPFAVGPRDVVLVISNDDPDEAVYNFVLVGTGDEDVTPPTMYCKDATVYLDGSGTAGITSADIDDGSFDGCAAISLSISAGAFGCSQVGANSIVLTGEDVKGNKSSCFATVNVLDTIPPDAKCKNVVAYLGGTGNVKVVPTVLNNGSTDNCGIVSYLTKAIIYDCSSLGPHPRVFTMQDASGNVGECVGTITVADSTRPVAHCRDRVLYVGQTITPADINNGSTDICGVSFVFGPCSFKGTATCGDAGTNVVPLIVTDPSGNTSTCISHVTVLDSIVPVAVCKPVDVYLGASGLASITPAMTDGGSTDNCEELTFVTDLTDFSCNDVGTQVVKLTVSDPAGNSSSCLTAVFVMDTISPAVTCSSLTIQLPAERYVVLTASMMGAMATDNCDAGPLSMDRDTLTCADLGFVNVGFTSTDPSGNTGTCYAMVHLVDTIGITSSLDLGPDKGWCPGDVHILDAGLGYSSYTWSTGDTSASITATLPGTYSVTVSTPLGCDESDTVTVLPYVLGDSLIVITGPASLCTAASLVLTAPFGYAMPVWSTGSLSTSITVTTGGWYSLYVTDPFSGCRKLDSIYVADGAPVVADITYDGSQLTASPAGAGYTYQWYLDGVLIPGATAFTLVPASSGDYSVEVTGPGGCTGTDLMPVILTGVDENPFTGLEVFPNPSRGNITIRPHSQIHAEVTIRVTDMSGRVILQQSKNQLINDEPLSLGQVAPGMYHLEIISHDLRHHVNLVVE